MSVASAEGENRAEVVVRESLTSPLLDHNLISGAKNILVNFVTAEANGLTANELSTILTYIQSHATTEDENGKRHTANIIWGTSSKAGLGDKLELVVVATGFSDAKLEANEALAIGLGAQKAEEAQKAAEAAKAAVAADEKPAQPAQPTQHAQPKQVVLGSRKSRYANIDQLAKQPAYKTRKVQLIVETKNTRKEVLKDSSAESAKNIEDNLLFSE